MDEAHRRWAWQRLRLLRSDPPGLAAESKARAQLVSAALEQCEQLMRAATSVEVAARPLPIFYALSQATRAICAVALKDDFLIRRHGLSWPDDGGRPERLMFRAVRPDPHPTSAFARLCEAIRCDPLSNSTEVGELWRALPNLMNPPLPNAEPTWTGALNLYEAGVRERVRHGGGWFEIVAGPVAHGATVSEMAEMLKRFPPLAPFELNADDQDAEKVVLIPHGGNYGTVLSRPGTPEGTPRRQMNDVVPMYQGDHSYRFVIPVLSTGDCLAPLALWWGILFALSNVARYEPDTWVACLDVDRSPLAVPLEDCLLEAIDVLPHFILEALLQRPIRVGSYV